MSWWFAECSALLQYVQQLFTSFAPCPHISWRCFTWSEQNSQAVEPHIVWRNQASMSAAFLKTIWNLLLLQLFDNRPIVCLKQVEYVGGKSQNIAESFQTQMTGTWLVHIAGKIGKTRYLMHGKSSRKQNFLKICLSVILANIPFWYRNIILV